MSPEFLKMQLLTAVIPATICGIIVVLFSRPWNESIRSKAIEVNTFGHNALGLACGFAFAFWAIMNKIPSFPVEEAYHSLFYIAMGVVLVAFINSFSSHKMLRLGLILILAAIASYFITPNYVFEDDEGNLQNVIWLWRAGYVSIAAVMFLSSEKLDEKIHSSIHAFIWFIVATGSSLLMLMAASAKLAQLCGAISAMSMAICVVCLPFSYISLTRSAMYFIAIFLPGIVLNGYWIGNEKIPFIAFLLVLISPIFVWLNQLSIFKDKMSSVLHSFVNVIFVIIPVAVSLLIAYQYYS